MPPNANKQRLLSALAAGSAAAAVSVPLLAIAAELQPALKNWLKAVFRHHWIGKSWIAVFLFIAVSLIFFALPYSKHAKTLETTLRVLFHVALFSALITAGFFLYEAF